VSARVKATRDERSFVSPTPGASHNEMLLPLSLLFSDTHSVFSDICRELGAGQNYLKKLLQAESEDYKECEPTKTHQKDYISWCLF